MANASIHIVTGTKFPSVTFNPTTSTFTLGQAGNFTGMFNAGAICTATGTSTANDGYYQVISSVYSGGFTTVTVESYAVGTSYPGSVPFVSSGTGTVIWFYAGVSVTLWNEVDGGIFGTDIPQVVSVASSTDALVLTAGGAGAFTINGGGAWTPLSATDLYAVGNTA